MEGVLIGVVLVGSLLLALAVVRGVLGIVLHLMMLGQRESLRSLDQDTPSAELT